MSPSEPAPPAAPSRIRFDVGTVDLQDAVAARVLDQSQADALWAFWRAGKPGAAAAQAAGAVRFSFGHTLYYFGGLLAISAMSLFMTLSWDAVGPWGVCALAILYGLACWGVAEVLLRRGLPIPAGLMGALAVCLVPVAVWAGQHALGLWPEAEGGISGQRYSQYHQWIDARWLTLEVATLLAGGLLLARLRLPFMVMPLAVTLWYMSMDLSRAIVSVDGDWHWAQARLVSLAFGIAMCVLAGVVDVYRRRRGGADFSTWLYLFGAIAAWTALSWPDSSTPWTRLLYALFNGGLVLFGAVIGRRIFTVLGAFGVAVYLGYLAFELFEDSLLFPLSLSALGLALVAAGVWWQRHEDAIQAHIWAWLPKAWHAEAPRGPS